MTPPAQLNLSTYIYIYYFGVEYTKKLLSLPLDACLSASLSAQNRLEAVADDTGPREEHSRNEKEGEEGSGGGGGGGGGIGSAVALAAALLRGHEVARSGDNDGGEIGHDGDAEVPLKLPPNLYDVDKILENTPLLRNDNAFHDTLNS